jgi:ubiquinone/menaquinone biosynthesis C-methylase UbiE
VTTIKEIEKKTALLYEDIHPFSEVDQTINDYLATLNVEEIYFKGKDVLDCGFGGTGWAIELFCRAGARSVTGIDINEKWVEYVSRRVARYNIPVDLMYGNVLNLSFKNDTFDYVHSHGVLHHTLNWKKGVEEMVRVCKPGGTIYLMLYGKYAPIGKAIHFSYRTLGKVIPYKWTSCIVKTTGIYRDHEISLLDAMYVPIEKHLSKKEILQHLLSLNMQEISFFNSHKWKEHRFYSSPFMFGKNIQNVIWAKKAN